MRSSGKNNSLFLIHGWFDLRYNSIPSKLDPPAQFLVTWQGHNLPLHNLPHHRILFQFKHTIAFLPFHTRLNSHMSEHVSFLCSIHLLFLHPIVLLKVQLGNPPI